MRRTVTGPRTRVIEHPIEGAYAVQEWIPPGASWLWPRRSPGLWKHMKLLGDKQEALEYARRASAPEIIYDSADAAAGTTEGEGEGT